MYTNNLLKALPLLVLVLIACSDESADSQPNASNTPQNTVAVPEVDIHAAVVSGDLKVVRQHIEAGSDINAADPFAGSSPLITAATFGKTEIARMLIAAGADINLTNGDGSTALHSAAFFCHTEIVDALLGAGVDKSIVNNYGSTALASVAGPFDQVKPFYDALGATLAPMGMTLDYNHLRKTRPIIAAKLQQ